MRILIVLLILMIAMVASGQEPIEGILIDDVFYPCPGMESLIEALERCVPVSTGVWVDGVLHTCDDKWQFSSPVEVIEHCTTIETASPQPVTHLQSASEGNAQVAQILYTVQTGDNLSFIAQRFGVTVEILVEVNHIDNPDLIHRGNLLIIPQG